MGRKNTQCINNTHSVLINTQCILCIHLLKEYLINAYYLSMQKHRMIQNT